MFGQKNILDEECKCYQNERYLWPAHKMNKEKVKKVVKKVQKFYVHKYSSK